MRPRPPAALVAIGVSIGALGAWSFHRSLQALVYDVSALDPLTWCAMIAVVALTTIAAAWRPCQRAAQVDPVQLLRQD